MRYQQCTRFLTTLDFDRKYLWNGSSNRQAKTAYQLRFFSEFDENNLVNVGPLTKKLSWPITLIFNEVRAVVEVHVRAKYHQAECSGSWVIVHTNFLPYLAMAKKPTIRSCDLNLWLLTLKFSGFRAVVKVHVDAKFHQTACSGSWVTEKKNSDENNRLTVRRYHADSNKRTSIQCCALLQKHKANKQ